MGMTWRNALCQLAFSVMVLGGATAGAAEFPPEGFGQWVSGGFFIGRTDPEADVSFNGKPVRVDEQGYYILGFGREAKGAQELVIQPPEGERELYLTEVSEREFQVQRIDGLPPSQVNPPEAVLSRIYREAEQVAKARMQPVDAEDWRQPFVWPTHGPVSGVYGSQRILNGEPKQPHWGIDIAVPTGTPVRAPAGGIVTLAAKDLYYTGGTVLLNHGAGVTSSFLHLSRLDVEEGQRVEQGELVGAVGSTGRSTGPHLDWRMNAGDDRIDAGLWVPPMESLCEVQGRGEEVVVLLHGLGRTDRSMEQLAEALRDSGFATCNQAYPSRRDSLPELAGYAANAIDYVRHQGFARVHLVTHSMGGILARYWLQYGELPGSGHLVMLSPPNHGSEIIDTFGDFGWFRRLMGPAAMELATDEHAMVNQLPPLNVSTGIITGSRSSDPWFNFLFEEPHDGKVSVSSARLTEAEGFRVVESGHTFIMNDPEVRFLVAFFLTNGFFP